MLKGLLASIKDQAHFFGHSHPPRPFALKACTEVRSDVNLQLPPD